MYLFRFQRLHHFAANSRWLMAMLLLNYGFICLGIPVPQWDHSVAGSAPFPCQGHHCGCRSAEHCWKSCCCMTAQQKLQWAKKQGVTPPAYVLVAAKQEEAENRASACCCCNKGKSPVASCSPHPKSCGAAAGESSPVPQPTIKSRIVVGLVVYVDAERCRGGAASQWLCVPSSLPLQTPRELRIDSAPIGYCREMLEPWVENPAYPPPAPPPRVWASFFPGLFA